MASEKFFDESREQSVVKAEIVEKYFDAWATIIAATQERFSFNKDWKLGYVDLFAGPGRYKDGAVSTPLRVLQKAIASDRYRNRFVSIFNDKDDGNVRNLEKEISKLPGIETLKHAPVIWNEEVGDSIATDFERMDKIPLLAFIDPWGYKGLSLRLVDAFLKDWGCDCIFFFNYARINAGLNNPLVREHMAALFGRKRAAQLSVALEGLSPRAREATIVNELALALKSFGHRYVLPFCFKNNSGKRTTHHLIFVTKHFKGYEVMKEIMASASSLEEQGVPSFVFSPADSKGQALLFDLNRPLDDLKKLLIKQYRGQTKTMLEIYHEHSIDKPFLKRNYKDILRQMELSGTITTKGRKSNRGFADYLSVTFPK